MYQGTNAKITYLLKEQLSLSWRSPPNERHELLMQIETFSHRKKVYLHAMALNRGGGGA